MSKREKKEIREQRERLEIIKHDVAEVRAAYKLYCENFPEFTKDGIVGQIAEESGKAKSTIWNIVTYQSIYETKDLKAL